jgi:hypothetical protein
MRTMVMVTAAVLSVGAAGMPRAVWAATIPVGNHSPGNVQKHCEGGTYFAPSSHGVYGCLAGDGSGIVCGGTGKDAKTCSTWGPTERILPTQSQVRAAEAREKAEKAHK